MNGSYYRIMQNVLDLSRTFVYYYGALIDCTP